eukprot:CAMPEP_0119404168 /NCGR_PEP_ID=MMETSP1334-20130426/143758_1 /TAXON_ID=127549 /ORGANISM="Calcidiscus leptoporus, Strain RCC1130" /LENGTH=121 /DNA_ID=CAMNT_0007428127 /DNA_START=1282 /DNA_END=1643 /DNA_ORIENTATION=-
MRISGLEKQQQRHRLHAIVPPVYEVAHKYVTRLWTFSPRPEEFKQIVELSMDVAADSDWALHRLHGRLLKHQLLHILAQVLEVELWQQLASPYALDPSIKVGPHRSAARRAAGRAPTVRRA